VHAGDIVTIAGIEDIHIGDTVGSGENVEALPRIAIDPPTLRMTFCVNDSPFAGRSGNKLQSRVLLERLQKEALHNVAIRVEPGETADTFDVSGRGELQLAILIEQMRREGYEFCVGKPQVITRQDNGHTTEPVEVAMIDCGEEFVGAVTQKLGQRKGRMVHMSDHGTGRVRLQFEIPSRGLIGYRTEMLSDTKGTGILNRMFLEYRAWCGDIAHRQTGVLVADRPGKVTSHAVSSLQDRGDIFVDIGADVYEGMIIGENSRDNDLNVNIVREKKLTNMRAASADSYVQITPPRKLSLEQCLEFIREDELVEIAPDAYRLRKRILRANLRDR